MGGVTAAVVLVVAGCAINPVTKRPEVVVMSTAKENEIGAKEAKKVEQEMRFVEDADLLAYVRAVGRRLTVHSPRQDIAYKFNVIDTADPNAFALPGGFVYVSRGLLAFTNSEEELANVLGHEIGHVAARHAVQRVTRATPIALATGVPALAVGIISPRMGRAVAQLGGVAGAVFLAPYSRRQENEADEIGQRMAAGAGWDPAGMPRFLHAVERDEALGSRPEGPGFLRSHPSTPERVRRTAKRATALTPVERTPIAKGRAAYLQKLEGLVVGENPAGGIFRGQRFLHPDFDVTFEFPAGWSTQNVSELVGAQSPNGEAVAVLQVQGADRDPVAAAQRFGEATKIDFSVEPGPAIVGRLPAAHAMAHMRGSQGDMLLDITWLSHRGMVFRIVCASAAGKAAAYRPTCLAIARSFRPLTPAERDGISVARLRAVRARKGERLDALVARTNSVWNAQQAAVTNGIEEYAPLRGGQLLKVPVLEPYVPSAP
jgi:predicted Zn-dependent protease